MLPINNILRTDGYKPSHWLQLPPKTSKLYAYLESRGGEFPEVTWFGITAILKEYFSKPITMADIDQAEKLFTSYFGTSKVFNRVGFEYIVKNYDGYWPLRIKSAPEGLTIPTRNILLSIENTDEQCAWATTYVEGMVMKVWYTTTVATISRNIKKLIKKYLEETGDVSGLPYKLHDFGYRGVSSEESAMLGGMSHLVNFAGSDTIVAILAAQMYYNAENPAATIPAAEHSTIMAWGREFEYEAYENMINQFSNGMYAVVSDTYDIYNATKVIWGEMLVDKVKSAPGMLVVRPDSGVPNEVVRQIVEILGEKFGYTVNTKGYKVLNQVRVIQGDGITLDEIGRILEALKIRGWSADNVAFGMGGALLQKMDRDTQKFALKASYVVVNGRERNIAKTPVTDNNKRSKPGRLKLVFEDGAYQTVDIHEIGQDVLQTIWENGKLLVDPTFNEIRSRAEV
jgi:nicotinamide phosphoribosyltransferase